MAAPQEWMDYAKSVGVPSVLAVGAYYLLPKLWAALKTRLNIAGQQNDLTQAGLGGVTDVVTTLRTQIADYKTDLATMRTRIESMEALLQKAVDEKLSAEQSEAIAKNDLFNLQLYVKRLIAQIISLGGTPVSENINDKGTSA